MHATRCLSCQILAGEQEVPGGIIYENAAWVMASKTAPLFVPGNLFLILKRHCEQLAELTPEEAAALGPLVQQVCAALTRILHLTWLLMAKECSTSISMCFRAPRQCQQGMELFFLSAMESAALSAWD